MSEREPECPRCEERNKIVDRLFFEGTCPRCANRELLPEGVELDALCLQPGDVLVLRVPASHAQWVDDIRGSVKTLREMTGCPVVLLIEDHSLDRLDEAAMLAAGWARVDAPTVVDAPPRAAADGESPPLPPPGSACP